MTKPVEAPLEDRYAWWAPESWVGSMLTMVVLTIDGGMVAGTRLTYETWAVGDSVESALARFKRLCPRLKSSVLSHRIVTDGSGPKIISTHFRGRGRPVGSVDRNQRRGYRFTEKRSA